MIPGAKSIRSRLLNLAKKENLSFHLVIIRYLQERLLYRVSRSRYNENFCLKGGVLLYACNREQTRPTMDIDFLGTSIPNDTDAVKSAFMDICTLEFPHDAVIFDNGSIETEEISGRQEYPGIRLFVTAHLDTIRQRIQVDIGFGDSVTPAPVHLNFPTLLPDSGIPVVQAYSLETVIAEKFEAMIDLSVVNSRMKDFYDVHQILTSYPLNPEILGEAIRETFHNRNTAFNPDHALFTPSFASDPARQRQWNTFLTKNHLDQDLGFEQVITKICDTLLPYWQRLADK